MLQVAASIYKILACNAASAILQRVSTLLTFLLSALSLLARPAGVAPAKAYTVAMPTSQLLEIVRGQVFTDSGRFFPCRVNPACATWGKDIAVSNPQIAINGPRLVFSVHLRVAALAARVGGSLGIEPEMLARALSHCSGSSLPISMLEHLPLDTLIDGARPFLKKDVAILSEVTADLGLDLGLLGEIAAWVNGSDPI